MENGTMIFYKATPEYLESLEWYERIVIEQILKTTKSKYFHVTIVLNGYECGSGHPFGATKEIAKYENRPERVYKYPVVPYTQEETNRMEQFFGKFLLENIRYNYTKLIAFRIIFPTKKFWDKIQYAPFENNFLWGVVCSVCISEVIESIGKKLIPGRYKETMSPQCCSESLLYKCGEK